VPPSTDKDAFLVMFSAVRPAPVGREQLTPVYLDQYTGEVLKESPRAARSAGDVIMDWVAPLHVGSFGGMTIRVAWLILGLAPPLLFVTAFIMWWSRVVRPRWLTARRSAVAASVLAAAIWAPQADAQFRWDERKDLIAFLESLTDREALRDSRWSDPWTQRTPA
jgi:uncharacterized iron-regulated membrane protein